MVSSLGEVKYAYIIGDYARGIDSGIIDLVLIGEINQATLQQLIEKTEKLINRKIRPMILTNKEFNKLNKTLAQEPFFIEHTASIDKAIELIARGVADASIELCQIGRHKVTSRRDNSTVKTIYPPVTTAQGYLLFSKTFYQQHQRVKGRRNGKRLLG